MTLIIGPCSHHVIRLLYNKNTRGITIIKNPGVFGRVLEACSCVSVITRALVYARVITEPLDPASKTQPKSTRFLIIEMDVRPLNYSFQVFGHIAWDTYKMFVSFRNGLGTDTPQMSPFTTKLGHF